MARDTSFYYAFLILPPAKRQAIVAVWDFCRAVDDAVDEAAPGGEWPLSAEAHDRARDELASWREEIARCYDSSGPSGGPRTAQGRALAPVIAAFDLPRAPFDDVIDGVTMDLGRLRYDTFDDLLGYCRRVASAVGLICIEIFGCRDDAAKEYAVDLGIALQLTNIIRDVGVDLSRGRVYLPQQDLGRFGCTEADLRRGAAATPVPALLAFECARAREYFARARAALGRTQARRLVAAEIMGAIYEDILQAMERAGYDVFSRVIRVPRPRRALIAFLVWGRMMMRRQRPTPAPGEFPAGDAPRRGSARPEAVSKGADYADSK